MLVRRDHLKIYRLCQPVCHKTGGKAWETKNSAGKAVDPASGFCCTPLHPPPAGLNPQEILVISARQTYP